MEISYLGGILERGPVERRPAVGAGAIDEDWGWMGEDAELFLHAVGPCCRLFTWDALALLVRGYARPSSGNGTVRPSIGELFCSTSVPPMAGRSRVCCADSDMLIADDVSGTSAIPIVQLRCGHTAAAEETGRRTVRLSRSRKGG